MAWHTLYPLHCIMALHEVLLRDAIIQDATTSIYIYIYHNPTWEGNKLERKTPDSYTFHRFICSTNRGGYHRKDRLSFLRGVMLKAELSPQNGKSWVINSQETVNGQRRILDVSQFAGSIRTKMLPVEYVLVWMFFPLAMNSFQPTHRILVRRLYLEKSTQTISWGSFYSIIINVQTTFPAAAVVNPLGGRSFAHPFSKGIFLKVFPTYIIQQEMNSLISVHYFSKRTPRSRDDQHRFFFRRKYENFHRIKCVHLFKLMKQSTALFRRSDCRTMRSHD